MNKYLCVLLLLMILASSIFCINQMNIIQTMTGEFNGSEFGNNIASIDFNADGYDDLVVSASAWNPNGIYNEQQLFGKLYFYWGGPSFDNVPDLTIQGSHYQQYSGWSIFNAGDINGDEHDDLVISNKDSSNTCTIEIFYSRANPILTPDVVLTYPTPQNIFAFPLGDINGDNHADLGLFFSGEAQRHNRRLKILTDITSLPILFRETNNTMGFPLISGVGDVNHDGIDDFYMTYPINGINSPIDKRLVLYYGSSSFPVMDSLVISDNTQANVLVWGNPVGDVNGDDVSDFVGYGNRLWLGGANLTANWNMELNSDYNSGENYNQYPFQHGDLNNDGFDDIISSNYYYGSYYGAVNIWMGRSNMNGTVDLNLWDPVTTEICNFGYAKAIGDFNVDGCDDIAVSAPWWHWNDHTEPGKVCVYAGNTLLQDTTVANEDDIMPNPDASKWDINIYPNPVHDKLATIMIEFIGTEYIKSGKLQLDIFNVRGQKLVSKSITGNALKSGCLNLNLKNLSNGNYIVSIRDNRQIRTTKKFNIITK